MGYTHYDKISSISGRFAIGKKGEEKDLVGLFHPGNQFFVDSGVGSDSNTGLNWSNALATIDAAVGKCTANNGDIIWVAPGHAESLAAAAALDCDVAGISILGIGHGSDRPTISFITATTADIDIDAANITIANIYFDLTGVDAVAAAIDVNAADFKLINCEILMADSAGQATNAITTAAGAHRMKIKDCIFRAPNAGANEAILIAGTPDGIEIDNCYIYGDFAVAPIHNATGNVATNLYIHDNYLQNDQTGDLALELVSACTGTIARNMLVTDAIATALDAGACSCFGNLYFDSSDTDKAATPIPILPTTGGVDLAAIKTEVDKIGTPAGADVSTDIAAIKTEVDKVGTVANTGGTATLGGVLGDVANISIATRLDSATKKTTIALGTTIPNNEQSAAGLLATATNGAVLIEEIIWQRGADNFVGPTNYEFSTDNAAGLTGAAAPNGVALLAKFNAAKTGILSIDGSTKQIPFVLESGKKLYIHGDDAATSAGGTTDFYIKYRRLAANAYLA